MEILYISVNIEKKICKPETFLGEAKDSSCQHSDNDVPMQF
jgi:hypothetical protein